MALINVLTYIPMLSLLTLTFFSKKKKREINIICRACISSNVSLVLQGQKKETELNFKSLAIHVAADLWSLDRISLYFHVVIHLVYLCTYISMGHILFLALQVVHLIFVV